MDEWVYGDWPDVGMDFPMDGCVNEIGMDDGSILLPLHDRGVNHVCVTWNKGVRRMLNISNMTHTALLGQLTNTCHISIQLVKRFCKFVDLMLTSRNAIVRHR